MTTDSGVALTVNGAQILNAGNIAINGGGTNTELYIGNNVLLWKGGTVTLSTATGGGNAYIEQSGNSFSLTLTNVDNTIQGNGIIGNNGLSVLNDAAGTILANAPGQTLLLNGSGTVTNNGTLQADSGSALHLSAVSFTNFSGKTLTGGTYNVYGTPTSPGIMQIDALGNAGGEIVNNATAILLNGSNSTLVDAAGKDALSNFSNNTAAGSFTIQNGRNMTTPGDFANAGTVTVGKMSTLTIGSGNPSASTPSGTDNFNQSAGTTDVNGTLRANTTLNGGTLSGGGTIDGNVDNVGGIITASDPGSPDILTINGDYTQETGAELDAYLQGPAAGIGGYSQLVVDGTATLDGTLDVILGSSFDPHVGENFFLLKTTGVDSSLSGVFSNFDTSNNTLPSDWELTYTGCPAGTTGCVDLIYEGPTTPPPPTSTPEPSVFLLLFVGMAMMTIVLKYRNTMRSGVK